MLQSEPVPTSAPVLRVYLFGECVLERLAAGSEDAGQTPRYERVSHDEWKGRGPALALLKLLLCHLKNTGSKLGTRFPLETAKRWYFNSEFPSFVFRHYFLSFQQ